MCTDGIAHTYNDATKPAWCEGQRQAWFSASFPLSTGSLGSINPTMKGAKSYMRNLRGIPSALVRFEGQASHGSGCPTAESISALLVSGL